jgi:1,4-dihydroxy-2-naphthoate octaprenyltransferase
VRPFAYTASVSAVALGLALAWHAGTPIHWLRFALTLVGVLCFHTGANLLSDCWDFRRGLDTVPGPNSGAIVRDWISPGRVLRGAAVFFAVGAGCGVALAALVGWPVLALGAAGALIALLYTGPRFGLKYVGLGDLAIFLAFGPLAVLGTWLVQTGSVHPAPLLWSLPVGLLTVAILHANNWRDIETDRARACRTPAARLGPRGSRIYYRALLVGAFALTALYVLAGLLRPAVFLAPPPALLALLALPVAVRLLRLSPAGDPATFAMLDAMTARLQLLFTALLLAGLTLA